MGAAENEAKIRGAYEAFNTGDVETLLETFDPEIVWHFPGGSKLAGEHIGRDATMAFLGGYGQAAAGTLRARLLDVIARDDRVAGWANDTASLDGKVLDVRAVVVFSMRDGRVVEAWHHFDDLYSVDAFLA
jgi:ketosteroid isomerase-like protein